MPATKNREPRFTTIQKLDVEYAPVTITQYESSRTGMRVVVVDQKGPKVTGYFALATEIHDDTGAPHTLEHLIFMGSRSYQYKGILDKLSSRNFAYTNAWTDTDHTAYELKTAGWQGFAQMLPVYLEHVVVPTLTDAACYTEVHHIDGEGNDAGVVYSEMQGCENTPSEIMTRVARALLYPESSGYRSETGGMMKELRGLTADRIRSFHKEMYQPKNLRLVIAGEVDHDEMLEILDRFEDSIEADVPTYDAPFNRPWVDSEATPVLNETKIETVPFPEEDESRGEIMVGYIGPKGTDNLATSALDVMLTYLCGSAISVMENVLVEKEQLCSGVYYYSQSRPDTVTWFSLAAVETDQLRTVYDRFLRLLKETASQPLDMDYLNDCLTRTIRQIKRRAETSEKFYTTPIIEDHIFGARDGRHLEDLVSLRELEHDLSAWTETQWRDFMKHWISDARHIVVLGVPSKELSDQMTNDEKARVAAQKERLGEEGLKRLAKQLKDAQAENDKAEPDGYLEKWPIPDTDSVQFIDVVTARSGPARRLGEISNNIQEIVDKDDHDSPLFIQFEHIPSNFVRVSILIETSDIPIELLPILSLYLNNLFTSPVKQNGERIEFEQLVLELEKETTSYHVFARREQIQISLTTETENYESVIRKMRTVLFDAIHDPTRLTASLTKLLAELPEEKRDGSHILRSVRNIVHYERGALERATNTLVKTLYLKRLLKLLRTDEPKVISQVDELCRALHRPENFRVSVFADLTKLRNPVTAWKQFTAGLDVSKPLAPLVGTLSKLSDKGKNPGSAAHIVPMSTIDSSYGCLVGKGPIGYDHPDLPALLLAISFLAATEGPLWVAVRGTGLAYGAFISKDVNVGQLHVSIYKSPDTYKAYVAAKEVIESYATGRVALNKSALEAAFSEIVFEMCDENSNMIEAADVSFTDQVMNGVSKTYKTELLAKIGSIPAEEVRAAMAKYLVPLFRPETANLFVTCAQVMVDGMKDKFTEAGFKPEVNGWEHFQDDYGLEAPEDGDDEDPEDEYDGGSDGAEEDED